MDSRTTSNQLIEKAVPLVWETLTVIGIVQGVGMRPFVARLADRHGLAGSVRNAGAHLVIKAGGTSRQLEAFRSELVREAPSAAQIVRLSVVRSDGALTEPQKNQTGFVIGESEPADGLVLISPDLAICPDCQRELKDPANRRFGHALISCMHCGPRFSIIQKLPYDRIRTTLQEFPLCPKCQEEYDDRKDRRYHAQTVSCPDCGPQLSLGQLQGLPALARAVEILENGGILGVKNMSGYHLVCRPDLKKAVARLRQLKNREAKPFAVVFPDLDSLRQYAELTSSECGQLCTPARPIVLVRPRLPKSQKLLHPLVASGSKLLGAFLPASPLQIQLTDRLGPLVMTSANLSGEIICTDDQKMAEFAAKTGLDGVLTHDRPIETGLDDSVLRLAGDVPLLIRRARGFVPLPVDLMAAAGAAASDAGKLRLIAAGSDLKAAFALVRDGLCYLGAPMGDLADSSIAESWEQQLEHWNRILDCRPDRLVVDCHPDYFSSGLLQRRFPDVPVMRVQHHQAHIASVLAENPGQKKVLGVAFDGTGYGTDGTIWGGEWLIVEGTSVTRAACLRPIPVAGGDFARKRAWQSLICHLVAAGLSGDDLIFAAPCLQQRPAETLLIAAACRREIGTVRNSSMGNLFDSVCAMLDFGDTNRYEGECGQLLEQAAEEARLLNLPAWPLSGRFGISENENRCFWLDPAPLFAAMRAALAAGADRRSLALGFHEALAGQVSDICQKICAGNDISVVALSGGCFQNVLLLEKSAALLRQNGLTVLTNRRVSPGDGGLALGQAWLGLEYEKTLREARLGEK